MAQKPSLPDQKAQKPASRDKRLAEALRANLSRRKVQQRERGLADEAVLASGKRLPPDETGSVVKK
jgi:hypothetical protein